MYPENDRVVDNLVRDMTELPILHVGKLNRRNSFYVPGRHNKFLSD